MYFSMSRDFHNLTKPYTYIIVAHTIMSTRMNFAMTFQMFFGRETAQKALRIIYIVPKVGMLPQRFWIIPPSNQEFLMNDICSFDSKSG